MCGRYTLSTDQSGLQQRFDFRGDDLAYVPREQVYPTNGILTVIQEGPERLGAVMHWGFLPPWAKGRALINAQPEKLATSNTWKRAFGSAAASSWPTASTSGARTPMAPRP